MLVKKGHLYLASTWYKPVLTNCLRFERPFNGRVLVLYGRLGWWAFRVMWDMDRAWK
jgi:hypothetical protein